MNLVLPKFLPTLSVSSLDEAKILSTILRYSNIEYVENATDSTLITNIYLTPKKKYGLGFDFNVSQSNIQKIGLSFSSGILIRNIFKGAETLQISALGAVGLQKMGQKLKIDFLILMN